MNPFAFVAVTHEGQAIDALMGQPGAAFIAGGHHIDRPHEARRRTTAALVDINQLPMKKVEDVGGTLRIGAYSYCNS